MCRCCTTACPAPPPTSLIWHSVLSQSLRLTVVPRRETTWLAKQPNTWLHVSCFPLCVYRQKAKRQLWNITCWHCLAKHLTHLNVMVILWVSEFEPSQAIGRRLCLDLSWWHKLTHTIETTNVGDYVYVYSCLVNSSLFFNERPQMATNSWVITPLRLNERAGVAVSQSFAPLN